MTSRFRLGRPTSMVISNDGSFVLFLRSGARDSVRELFVLDTRSGAESRVATADTLLGGAEESLSPEERARRERLRLSARGITSFELSKDNRRLLIPLSGKLFVMTVNADGTLTAATDLSDEEGYANDARLSPDGNKIAYVRDGDLFVIDIATRQRSRITTRASEHITNGLPEFVAQEEMARYEGYWWSPDSARIVFQQTDESQVERLSTIDPLSPEDAPSTAAYPRAGRTNASVRLFIADAGAGRTDAAGHRTDIREIEWDREAFPYLATAKWNEGAPLTLLIQDRRQRVERLLAVDTSTLASTLLLEERDDAWLNLATDMPKWIHDGAHFLWMTEREGAWTLELRNRDGSLARALTQPDLGLEEVLHYDEEHDRVWLAASSDPTEMHVARLSLAEGASPERFTSEAGVHTAIVSENGAFVVLTSETLQNWPTTRVLRTDADATSASAITIASVAATPSLSPNITLETVGEEEFRVKIIRPTNMEEGRRYPVLVSVYGGPHVRVVTKTRGRDLWTQWIADLGFIVVSADGRGTPGRGRAWERTIAGNFIDVPLRDQVTALRALCERHSELDCSRVGIYGWSFGGYFSAMAALREPDVFHAAIAGAPVIDWADYDTHYTERYIGLPEENVEGYRASNVLTYAHTLRRPLLLIHGTTDDNVYFIHAMKLSQALLRAGRPHELLPLAGATHMVADPELSYALDQYMARFFLRSLP